MINKLTTKLSGMALLCISLSLFSQQKKEIKLENYFGDLSARQIGPAVMSGRISDMENHPTDPMIIYAGSAGGGVWKSNDAGTTFYPIFDDHAQSIGAVELDPNDPDNTIYVGTGEPWPRNSVSIGDGLYKSNDGGNNWKKIGLENSERIANIIVNPENSNEIYVATYISFEFSGFTIMFAILSEFSSPIFFQLLPPSFDLYKPSPIDTLFLGHGSPVPT